MIIRSYRLEQYYCYNILSERATRGAEMDARELIVKVTDPQSDRIIDIPTEIIGRGRGTIIIRTRRRAQRHQSATNDVRYDIS